MKLDFREFDKAYNEDINRRLKEKENKQIRKQEMGKMRQFTVYGLIVLLAFIVGARTIYGYVELNKYKYENELMSDQIEKLESEIAQLRIQLDNKVTSEKVQTTAMEKIGMVFAAESQTRTIQVTKHYALNPDAKSVIVREENEIKSASASGN